MGLSIEMVSGKVRSAYLGVFGGRIARTTFVIRVAILGAAIFILLAPLSTILAPSSKTLRDVYLALFFAMLALCLLGFSSAYVKRLHDIGLRGYWALVFFIALPFVMILGGRAYVDYRRLQDSTDVPSIYNFLNAVPLVLPLLIAMWRGDKGENRFGPVPEPVEHVGASKFNIAAAAGAAAILIPTCIYAGLFQSGVWVGRGDMPPSMPMIDSNYDGQRFMRCWNVKGVGAGSGEGPLRGVYRDGYGGAVLDFVASPDGEIDVVAGNAMGRSFRSEGFRIVPYGLKLPENGSGYISVLGLNRFMLVAIFDQGGPDAAIDYTSFAFGRNEGGWPEYHMVMSVSRSASVNSTVWANFPEARGKLMIGDCMPG